MKIKSITDVITNSSTEVFIVKKDEIHPRDSKLFDTYKSKEEIYKIAENWNKGWKNGGDEALELAENIYRYIIYFDPDVCEYDIRGLLTDYGLGPLAGKLKYNLVDVLKMLEPLWEGVLDYGFFSFADDCGPEPDMKGSYQVIDRI